MFKEILKESKILKATYSDGLGNKKTIICDGNKVSLTNQNNRALSLSNIAFNLNIHGKKQEFEAVKNATIDAYQKAKGNENTFAQYLTQYLKIPFTAGN